MNESSSMGTKNILYKLFPRHDSSRSSSPDAVDISFSLQQLFSASLPVLWPVFMNVSDILIVKTKQRLQTRSKILLACLALTDLLTGLILQPACLELSLICLLQGKDKTDLCKVDLVFTSSFILFWFASVCHLVIMTCEQYGTIKCSFTRNKLLAKALILYLGLHQSSCWFSCLNHYSLQSQLSRQHCWVQSSSLKFSSLSRPTATKKTHQISSYIEAKKIPKREKSPKNNYNNDTEDFSVFPFALCFRPCMKFSQMEKDSNNNSSFYRCDGKFEFIS